MSDAIVERVVVEARQRRPLGSVDPRPLLDRDEWVLREIVTRAVAQIRVEHGDDHVAEREDELVEFVLATVGGIELDMNPAAPVREGGEERGD